MKKYYSQQGMSLDLIDKYLEDKAKEGWELVQVLDTIKPIQQSALNIRPGQPPAMMKVFVPLLVKDVEDEKDIPN